jgi:hypothetical protein
LTGSGISLKNTLLLLLLVLAQALVASLLYAEPGEFAPLVEKKGPAAREVVDSPTLYRVADMQGLPCSKAAFEFLLDRPRLSMALARQLDPDIEEYNIEVRPDGSYHVDDRGRLVGDMELISRQDGGRVYYIAGYWRLLGIRFNGRMVLAPEYSQVAGMPAPSVNARARGYMKVDSTVAGVIAKVVAKIFPGKVDNRMERFAGAVRKVAEAINADPEGVYKRLLKIKEAPPGEVEEYRLMFLAARGVKGARR